MSRSGLQYLDSLGEWKGGGDFTLSTVRAVLDRLLNPQEAIPVLHVAGTNGKGSVSSAIASIMAARPAKVCLNISPHLNRINERIIVDGWAVEDELLDECARTVQSTVAEMGTFLSFHEAMTVCAFLVAQRSSADFLVLEVGLGGRLDSSNVVSKPIVTAVTSIDFDHEHVLGSTFDAIAREKAGIARPNVPMVLGPLAPEALKACREICGRVGSRCIEWGRDYLLDAPDQNGQAVVHYSDWKVQFRPSLAGLHQYQNMAVAIVCGLLAGATESQCKQGVEGLAWPGRLELCEARGQRFLLDCAHNPAGVRSLTSHLDRIGERKITMVFGVLETKNHREMIEELAPFVGRWCLVTPKSVRAVCSDRLKDEVRDIVSSADVSVASFNEDYTACLESVITEREADGRGGPRLCCVAGSMYMLGAMRDLLRPPERPLWKVGS